MALSLTIATTACGFKLRGVASLPFTSLYVQGNASSAVVSAVKARLQQNNVQIVADPKAAQALLDITGEAREKLVLALSGDGKVREFELRQRVDFRLLDNAGRELIGQNQIQLVRTFTFNDAEVLAKQNEENLLYRDMQEDAVQQILRRLQTVKPAS